MVFSIEGMATHLVKLLDQRGVQSTMEVVGQKLETAGLSQLAQGPKKTGVNAHLAFLGTGLNVKMLMNVRNTVFVDVMAAPARTLGVVMNASAKETFCI